MRIPLVVISFVERGVPEVIDGQVSEGQMSEGQVPEYSINPRSPIVQSVDMLNHSLIERMLGEEKVREIWECDNLRGYIRYSTQTTI